MVVIRLLFTNNIRADLSPMSPTCLSGVVRDHLMVTHWGVARVHGSARWGPSVVWRGASVVRRRSTVVWWWSSGVHAWWMGPRVRARSWGLTLSLGLGGCCSLLLYLLPCLHLSIFELLHVERLTLREQLLPLKLQLHEEIKETQRERKRFIKITSTNKWQPPILSRGRFDTGT